MSIRYMTTLQAEVETLRKAVEQLTAEAVEHHIAERRRRVEDASTYSAATAIADLESRVTILERALHSVVPAKPAVLQVQHDPSIKVQEPYHGVFPPSHISYEGAD